MTHPHFLRESGRNSQYNERYVMSSMAGLQEVSQDPLESAQYVTETALRLHSRVGDNKPKSATNNTFHARAGVMRHQSLNVMGKQESIGLQETGS